MKSPRRVTIPPALIRTGLVWGHGLDRLHVYATTRVDLCGVPSEIDGVPVVHHVTGGVRPAAR